MFDWITGLIDSGGPLAIALLMFLENVFPPIPSELIMPLAGFNAARGGAPLWLTILAGTAGSLAGAYFWFYLGRRFGAARLRLLVRRHGRWLTMSPADLRRTQNWFDRHGDKAVFFGRFIPTVRTLISVPAGLARMPMWKFLAFTTIGSAIWTSILTFAGLLLHENYALVADYVDPLSKIVVITVVAVYLWRVIRWKPH